jgi:serine/threonine protein kinase
MSSKLLPVGTRLDRFVISSAIASGGFGNTYAAEHVGLSKFYALKECFPHRIAMREPNGRVVAVPGEESTYADLLKRVDVEAKALARCRHPNIVVITDVFEANGTMYMALELEIGSNLTDWLNGLKRKPTQAELSGILNPLLDALDYMHKRDLLHRDIAPDNIMIRSDGTPCLIDFGAVRFDSGRHAKTKGGNIVKFGYSPPEQYLASSDKMGPWSDIYSLGATLYRAMVGKRPPHAIGRRAGEHLKPLRRLLGTQPDVFDPLLLIAVDVSLRLDPAKRPQSVAQFRRILSSRKARKLLAERRHLLVPGQPAPGPKKREAKAPAAVEAGQIPIPPEIRKALDKLAAARKMPKEGKREPPKLPSSPPAPVRVRTPARTRPTSPHWSTRSIASKAMVALTCLAGLIVAADAVSKFVANRQRQLEVHRQAEAFGQMSDALFKEHKTVPQPVPAQRKVQPLRVAPYRIMNAPSL